MSLQAVLRIPAIEKEISIGLLCGVFAGIGYVLDNR